MIRSLSILALVVPLVSVSAEEPAKFVGTWLATTKAVGFDHSFTLKHENTQWTVDSKYTKESGPTGTAHGIDIKFEDGKLFFVQKYSKKPYDSWKDSKDQVTLSFNGDQLELFNVTTNKTIRTYNRVDAKATPKASNPLPKPEMPKTEPVTPGVPKAETPKADPPRIPPAAKPVPKLEPKTTPKPEPKTPEIIKLSVPANLAATEPVEKYDLLAKAFFSSVNSKGTRLAVATFDATKVNAISLFDLEGKKALWTKTDLKIDAFSKVVSLAVSHDGKYVACDPSDINGKRSVLLIDGATGKSLPTLSKLQTGAEKLAFHPSRPILALGFYDPKTRNTFVAAIDAPTAKLLWRLDQAFDQRITVLAFSPSGEIVACAGKVAGKGDQFRVRVLNAAKGTLLHDFPTDKREITSIAFSADSKWLAVYHSDQGKPVILIYDLETNEKVKEITDIPGGLGANHQQIAFAPDGKTLAAGTWDGHVRLIDMETGKVRALIVKAFDRSSGLGDVQWSADGALLSVVNAKLLRVYRAADAKVLE